MGQGLVEALQAEFPIQADWVGLELHPETPPQGKPMTERFTPQELAAKIAGLNQAGAPFGLTFGSRPVLANSHLALAAGEFARERSAFQAWHHAAFRAYFTDGQNIGLLPVILDLARQIGLDPDELAAALSDGRYEPVLAAARAEATRLQITAVPTFIVNGERRIVGAQPLPRFRALLAEVVRRPE